MLNKVVSIKNVGRFKCATAVGPQLKPYVLLWGANGSGKTTLCAILRSLRSGDPGQVIGRKSLGNKGDPEIDLLTDGEIVRFTANGGWSKTIPAISIFDATFVTENVYSGEFVDVDHKRRLYRVIIGQNGTILAEEEARLVADIRAKTSEIKSKGTELEASFSKSLSLNEFLRLPTDPEIDAKIASQQKILDAVRQSEEIRRREPLRGFSIPDFPNELGTTLAATIEGVAADVENRVRKHLAAHGMTEDGQAWLGKGLLHIADQSCPFCGQSLRGLSLMEAYHSLFSEGYRMLKNRIESQRKAIAEGFSEAVIGQTNTQAAENRRAMEFWGRYCSIETEGAAPPETLASAIRLLRDSTLALLDQKSKSPLEPISPDADFAGALATFTREQNLVSRANERIKSVNASIAARKADAATSDVRTEEAKLDKLRDVKKRHEQATKTTCDEYQKLESQKRGLENRREAIRKRLEEHTEKVIGPYESRINEILRLFNADFQIARTKHNYMGGVATSSYQIVIEATHVDLGDSKTTIDKPSFRNTLSAGDRTTLALAFFLANLEGEADLANRLVVFDDPFNSQDSFRRSQTIFEIKKKGNACGQIIVLSHDIQFLRNLWELLPPDKRCGVEITAQCALGSKIVPCDIEDAAAARVMSDLSDLKAYVNDGKGEARDLARKMRIVLETHLRRVYGADFDANDTLGEIVEKIRKCGGAHSAWGLLTELDEINVYSRDDHHGDNPNFPAAGEPDKSQLRGFVQRTLKIVNA
jgi:wobble nucleotide-excising tRNase